MEQDYEAKESTAVERKGKDKDKKKQKQKDEKPKDKKTRRHFREEAKQAQTQSIPEANELKPELNRSDSATSSLSPSAIIEMFHFQDDEYSFSSSALVATTARHLVENEVSGDFYQVKTRQRKQYSPLPDHARHRRSSLVKAQQKLRDGSVKAESWACWTILQRDGEKAAVVMVLGVVAGMCWMDALNLRSGNVSASSGGTDRFLCAYTASADRSRLNLFVLFKYPSPLQI
ncbi:hypothetical protein ON010_g7044 [Phytophthora cinnamomi]|nr:hypothetical protein ON010_g7044 [Phytophthora cinnamomi]